MQVTEPSSNSGAWFLKNKKDEGRMLGFNSSYNIAHQRL